MDLSGLGKKPVSPELPAGREVRDTDAFLALQAEIDHSQSITSTGGTNWKTVENISAAILDTLGKDLLVGCYLSVALARNQGPPGVLTGLSILHDLVADHWDGLFPPIKRIRGRRNALIWWIEQLQEVLPVLNAPELSPEDHARGLSLLKRLNGLLGNNDPDGPMLNILFPLAQAIPVEERIEPAASPEQPTLCEPERTPQSETVHEPSRGARSPEEILDRSRQELLEASLKLFEQNVTEPLFYRYGRMFAWDPVSETPSSDAGITRIPAPPAPVATALEALLQNGSAEDLLRFSEMQQQHYPFWLDLSYHSFCCLSRMNEAGASARLAISQETGYLTGRLPDLLSLHFSDETPFASSACREWISSLSENQDSSKEKVETSSLDQSFKKIRSLLEDRRLPQAVEQFGAVRRTLGTPRLRFLYDLELLSLVSGNGRDFPLESLAGNLLSDLDRFNLLEWEPELAKRALSVLYRVYASIETGQGQETATSLLRKLAAMDLPSTLEAFQMRR